MTTEIEISNYKGTDIFTVWEIDESGSRKQFPLISFGKRKALAVLRHLSDLKDFCLYYDTTDIPWAEDDKGMNK